MKKVLVLALTAMFWISCGNTEEKGDAEVLAQEEVVSEDNTLVSKWLLADLDITLNDAVPAEQKELMNQMFGMMKQVMIGQMFMDFKADASFISGTPNPQSGQMMERPGTYVYENGTLITTEVNEGTEFKDTVQLHFDGPDTFSFESEENEGTMKMKFTRQK